MTFIADHTVGKEELIFPICGTRLNKYGETIDLCIFKNYSSFMGAKIYDLEIERAKRRSATPKVITTGVYFIKEYPPLMGKSFRKQDIRKIRAFLQSSGYKKFWFSPVFKSPEGPIEISYQKVRRKGPCWDQYWLVVYFILNVQERTPSSEFIERLSAIIKVKPEYSNHPLEFRIADLQFSGK